MSNSSLVVHTNLSPNCTKPRTHVIDTITIHCVVGQCTAETLGNIFAPASRQASSNYGVDKDGRVGLYVDEANRSWCTSSASNDHRAITIEVASDTTAPYAVNDKAFAGLLDLVTDICRRNGIKELKWQADKSLIGQVDKQNMTVHRWFANKSCPGDYLYNLHGKIAEEVNKRLGTATETTTTSTTGSSASYRVRKSATDSATQLGAYSSLDNAKKAADGNAGYKVYDMSGNLVYDPAASSGTTATTSTSYLVRVTASELYIRKGPGTGYGTNGSIKDKGTYTIVEESTGTGAAKWGKLKSGAGWISLDYTEKV